jgi:hypothetical protein
MPDRSFGEWPNDRERAVSPAARGVTRPTVGSRATDRPSDVEGSQPVDPYRARAGPLMTMVRALDRADRLAVAEVRERRLDVLEQEMRAREASAIIAASHEAGIRAGAASREVHRRHQRKVKGGKKDGIGFGVTWLADEAVRTSQDPTVQEKVFRQRKAALEAKGLKMVSCLTMMGSSMPEYVDGLGAGTLSTGEKVALHEKLARALRTAEDAQGTGKQFVFGGRATVVLEQLRTGFGFETVHIDAVPGPNYPRPKSYTSDAGTRASGKVPNRPAVVTGAFSRQPIDVQVGVDRFVKLGKKPSAESRDLFESLKQAEYAVGIADSGFHAFTLAGGMVYEVHWDRGPRDPKLTSAIPLDQFFKKWGSAVIAVPPGTLKPKPPQPQR